MSFDLTNKKISETFQNVLQKTGSEGRLYDLEGNAVRDLVIDGTLTANTYVTSQSVVHTSSGSNTFGNSHDDTHQFTGSIYTTGSVEIHGGGDSTFYINPQASAGVAEFGTNTYDALRLKVNGNNSIYFDQGAATIFYQNTTFNKNIRVANISASGHISASGNISGSSTSTGSFGSGYFDENVGIGTTPSAYALDVDGVIQLTDDLRLGNGKYIRFSGQEAISGNTTTQQMSMLNHGSWQGIKISGHITSSGDISGSGTSTGSLGRLETAGDFKIGGGHDGDLAINGGSITLDTQEGLVGGEYLNFLSTRAFKFSKIGLGNSYFASDLNDGAYWIRYGYETGSDALLNHHIYGPTFVSSSASNQKIFRVIGASETELFSISSSGFTVTSTISASGNITASGNIYAGGKLTVSSSLIGDITIQTETPALEVRPKILINGAGTVGRDGTLEIRGHASAQSHLKFSDQDGLFGQFTYDHAGDNNNLHYTTGSDLDSAVLTISRSGDVEFPLNYQIISGSGTSTSSFGRYDAVDGFYEGGSKISDYVFEPEYILRSLEEVEQHISESKHLPGIPSEKDIQDWRNLSMGERDRLLLEKIEELTLYVISLQKQIDDLKK